MRLTYNEMWEIIRGFGYTTKGQTDELVDAIVAAEKKKKKEKKSCQDQ